MHGLIYILGESCIIYVCIYIYIHACLVDLAYKYIQQIRAENIFYL